MPPPTLGILLALALWLGPSRAAHASSEWQFIGARYQGMAGAGVAVADDSLALYWNPGALGFTTGHDAQFPFGVSVSAEGNVMSEIDELDALARDVNSILKKISDGEPLSDSEKSTVLQIVARDIPLFNDDDEGFLPRANIGLTGRTGGFAFGIIGDGDSVIAPFEDDVNLGLDEGATPGSRIASFVGAGNDRSSELSSAGQSLADLIADDFRSFTSTGLEQNQAEEYVFLAESGGLDTSNAQVSDSLRQSAQATAASRDSLVSNNLTGAAAVTLVTAETTLAYGHSFFDMVGIGGAVRYIYGNTFVDYTTFNDVDSVRELIKETLEFNNRADSHNFAVDLGVLIRPTDWLRIGVVGRNLNEPDFDVNLPASLSDDLREVGISIDEYQLERQFRAGVAVQPFSWWTIAADIDLTRNNTPFVRGLESRLLSIGTEARLSYKRVGFALRAGTFMNLGHDQNQDPVLTGGFGLRFWKITFDLSASVATERDQFESIGTNDHIPVRVGFAGQIGYHTEF